MLQDCNKNVTSERPFIIPSLHRPQSIIPSCMGLIRVKSSVAMAASHWENSVTIVNCRDLARGCDLRHIGEKARDRKLSNRLVLAKGIS